MSNKILNENNLETSILRCPICKLIPSIKSNFLENSIEFNCPNGHIEKGLFNNIYTKLKEKNDINKMKCNKCLNEGNFYCIKCFKFFCEKDGKIKDSQEEHNLINKYDIDNYCLKDKDKIVMFCKTENKLLCGKCDHEKNNCKIIPLKQMLLKKELLENYNEKLLNMENNKENDNDDEYKKILDEIEELLITYLNKIKAIKNIFIDNNKNFFHFYHDLLNCYNYKINKKCYNFNIINNLNSNFNNINNKNNFSYIFEDLNNKLFEIENKYDNIIYKIKENFEKKNIVNFDKSYNIANINNFFNINYGNEIYTMKVLFDKRLALGGDSSNLLIINNNTFDIDLKINNNKDNLNYIDQLKNENLILCFSKIIRIIRLLKNNSYKIIQDINAHESDVWNVKELYNSNLISCSHDKSLKIWSKKNENEEYREVYKISESNYFNDILEIKPNEIIYDVYDTMIKFYNIKKRMEIKKIENLNLTSAGRGNSMIQMNKNTIIVGGDQKIYFFDTNTYEKIADIKYSYWIYSLLKINDESFIIGDKEGNLCQFNFVTKKRISTKSKVHNSDKIYSIVIFNNYLVSGGNQTIIKIWK